MKLSPRLRIWQGVLCTVGSWALLAQLRMALHAIWRGTYTTSGFSAQIISGAPSMWSAWPCVPM